MKKSILGKILQFIIRIKLLKRLAFFFFYSIIEFKMGDAFMSQVYTGIELGTDSIKIVVLEKLQNKFHVLASVHSPSEGVSKGQVVDIKKCVSSVRAALRRVNDMLGIRVIRVIAVVPTTGCHLDIAVGSIEVEDSSCITGEDVSRVLKDALVGRIDENRELVTAVPISFTVDEHENIPDPKGMSGAILETKVVVATVLKEPLYRILEVLKLSGLEAIDVCFTSTGDYYAVRNKRLQKEVGAIIDIGEETTEVSVFNKGIQIKNAIIPIGSHNVDRDISYIFKIKEEDSRRLKEQFAVSMQAYADSNDSVSVPIGNDKKEISQIGISKVVEARLEEILNLAKKEIKNLTNREIRYIIVTGGLSELAGFQYLVESIFGINAKVCNISTMGLRHNRYSSVLGAVQYFDDKMSLRGKNVSMISEGDIQSLMVPDDKTVNSDNIISKVFGHFFDN